MPDLVRSEPKKLAKPTLKKRAKLDPNAVTQNISADRQVPTMTQVDVAIERADAQHIAAATAYAKRVQQNVPELVDFMNGVDAQAAQALNSVTLQLYGVDESSEVVQAGD